MAEKEGEFQLHIEPTDKVVFKSKKLDEEPVVVMLNITNPTDVRHAVKVKCTSNEMFRIRPPLSAINPNESTIVQLTFNSQFVPESGKHYFVVYHIKSDDDEKTPREVWADHNGDPVGTKRLLVDFDFDNEDDAEEMVDDENVDNNNAEIEKDEGNEEGSNEEEDKQSDIEKSGEDPENEADENNN